jgi:ribose transport system substrate-binding protein
MRNSIAVMLIGILALFAASCRNTDDAKAKKKGKIGLSVLTMSNPFFKEIADVFKAEMEAKDYEVLVVDPDEDVVRQQNQVQDFITQKVSAIVLCPCKAMEIGAAIQMANEARIPVFTADLGTLDPKAKVETHIATDNLAGGKLAGEAMIEALGPAGGKILVLDMPGMESCLKRVQGFEEVIEAHNKTKATGKIIKVSQLNCGGNKEKGNQATLDAMQRHSDLKGIFAINDPAALGARAALEKLEKADQVKIIAFDGQLEAKKAILEGKIYAHPIQHPDQIAKKTAEAILRYFAGDAQLPKEILIPTNLYRKADAEKDPAFKK